MADTPRRLFIGSKGQPSAVLRSKKDEPEEDARKRLAESGWNMDAPHTLKHKDFHLLLHPKNLPSLGYFPINHHYHRL